LSIGKGERNIIENREKGGREQGEGRRREGNAQT
jgi:hypothetical protein